MKLEIEFNNLSKGSFSFLALKKTVGKTLEKAGVDFLAEKEVKITFANVSEEEIKRLNRTYRRKNAPTDVLSFSEYKNKKEIGREKSKEIFLGEVVLCFFDIEKYCRKNKISPKEESAKAVAHGVLHLLGMRHGEKMFSIQDEAAKNAL